MNQKSDGFPFRKLNDFESRNGGRERLKTRDAGGKTLKSEVGWFRHRKRNDFPSRNVGKVKTAGKRRWEETQSEIGWLHPSTAKRL